MENTITYESDYGKQIFKEHPEILESDSSTSSIVYYQHVYRLSGFSADSRKRHSCLSMGKWCFENFKEYPRDIFTYIKTRTKR